jgi:hypothetical protein
LEKATGYYVVRQLGNCSKTHYAEARVKSPSLNRRFVIALHSPTIFVETGLRFCCPEKKAQNPPCWDWQATFSGPV